MKFFMEIGSADFDTLIPLAKNGWHGIIVEPVPEFVANLEKHPNIIYENSAINTKDGEATLRYYDPVWAKDWRRGVGSISSVNNFNRNPQLKEKEKIIKVPCYTLDTLIKKHNITQIDYLKIDVEGLEKDILNSYSFAIKPTFIKCEHIHWKEKKEEVFEKLKNLGYLIEEAPSDFFAIG